MKKIANITQLNENYFAVAGGMADTTFGNPSHMVQGNFPGYTYTVLGFSDALQQKANNPSNEYYIHPGCLVRGVGFNNPDKTYTGTVNRIVKNESGEIICLYILTQKTSKMVTIRADENLELLIQKGTEQKGLHNFAAQQNMNISR
jgi:hypothetical protein